jgi:AcrR family transcriptional regulator
VPKRIENLQETILQQAKQLMLQNGYPMLTMREVAARCGIAVGTLYNYFPSKEALAGGIMLEDWHSILAEMKAGCTAASELTQALTALYEGVSRFSRQYSGIWASYGFVGSRDLDFARRHRLLVRQLADCLAPLLEKQAALPQTDLFLAENVLICAGSSEMEFSSFLTIAQRLCFPAQHTNGGKKHGTA